MDRRGFLIGVAALTALFYVDKVAAQEPKPFPGLCYGPFRKNEAPGVRYPTQDELRADLTYAAQITPRIRCYETDVTLANIPLICRDVGLECSVGSWLTGTNDDASIKRLITQGQSGNSAIKLLIVGNELLRARTVPEQYLVDRVQQVKDSTPSAPVAAAETLDTWLSSPNLAKTVDTIVVHLHPFWASLPPEQSGAYVQSALGTLKQKYPDKPIIIGETGYPSKGKPYGSAKPSTKNQEIALNSILTNLPDVPTFLFEFVDEPWKTGEDYGVGPNWGLYTSNGKPKRCIKNILGAVEKRGWKRPAGRR